MLHLGSILGRAARRPRTTAAIAAGAVLLLVVPLANATPPGVSITVKPTNPADSKAAQFSFESPDASATFACRVDGGLLTTCTSPISYQVDEGVHTFTVTATNETLETSSDSFTWAVDTTTPAATITTVLPMTIVLTPPGPVRRAVARTGDATVLLTWALPTARDLASVRIARSTVGKPGTATIYRGLGTSFKNTGLKNDVAYRFVLVAFDKDGNASEPVVVWATPKALLLAAPKPSARVTNPPLLRWAPVPLATYFNVQLYRAGVKILSAWPATARLQLTPHWSYRKHTLTLKPGVYSWFVWPGLGARADARYGELLGKSSFVVTTPKKL